MSAHSLPFPFRSTGTKGRSTFGPPDSHRQTRGYPRTNSCQWCFLALPGYHQLQRGFAAVPLPLVRRFWAKAVMVTELTAPMRLSLAQRRHQIVQKSRIAPTPCRTTSQQSSKVVGSNNGFLSKQQACRFANANQHIYDDVGGSLSRRLSRCPTNGVTCSWKAVVVAPALRNSDCTFV